MSEKIHYSELVDQIAEKSATSKKIIHDLLKETVNAVNTNLADEGEAHLSGFGKFHLEWRESRPGRNPQTGESIEIPANNRIIFKPGAEERRFINREYEHLKPIFLDDKITEQTADASGLISGTDPTATPSDTKKKHGWLWLLPLILIIFLVWFFWPAADEQTDLIIEENILEVSNGRETIVEDIIVVEETNGKDVKIDEVIVEETVITKAGTTGGTYSVSSGDNLWGISADFYNDEFLWPNIFKENMSKIKDPDILTAGLEIDVPSLEGTKGSWTSHDLEAIAEGYMQTYFIYKELRNENAVYYLWVAKKTSLAVYNKHIDKVTQSDIDVIASIKGDIRF